MMIITGHSSLEPFVLSVQSPATKGKFEFSHTLALMNFEFCFDLKGPFGPLLAPPEGLRDPGVPGVNPGGRLQESGGDSKAN